MAKIGKMGKQGQTKKKWENKAKIGIIRKAGPNTKDRQRHNGPEALSV